MKTISKRIIQSSIVSLLIACCFLVANNKDDNNSNETNYETAEIECPTNTVLAGVSLSIYANLDTAGDKIADIESENQYIVGSAPIEDTEVDAINTSDTEWYSVEDTEMTEYTYTKINVRSGPSTDSDVVGKIDPGETLEITGTVSESNTVDGNWVQITYNDETAYVCSDYIQEDDFQASTYNNTWDGEILNSYDGKVSGPSGHETYYNLSMSRVVYYMQCLGYDYDYWVRDDGVKMFGPYVMVAADLSIRPKGTIVETSMGTGIVCDTGSFVEYDSTRLDIAVNWE